RISTCGIYTLSLHDALPISRLERETPLRQRASAYSKLVANRTRSVTDSLRSHKTRNGKLRSSPSVAATSCRATPKSPQTNSPARSEEHTSELQSRENLVCRL